MLHSTKTALSQNHDAGWRLRGKTTSSRVRAWTLALAVAASLGATSAIAQADPYAGVHQLVRSGQLNEALVKADQYLATKPADPQMRFLKGVIQTESGKSSDAVATFLRLTEDYPELPEPYNNLAVLYASQSQFDKARAALEMAIRTNPSYATAHENLGDIYARLASQAYSKALQLDATNTGAAPKLNLIRNLFSAESSSVRPERVASAPAAAAPMPAQAPAPAPAPTAAAAPTPTPAAPAPAAPQAAPADASQSEVAAAVQAWAQAWSSKSMSDYLGAYAPGFEPAGGQARSAWEAERRARIVPRQRINVGVSDLNVSVEGDRATARFRQDYASDNLNVTSLKTLSLIRSGDRWLITRESTGS